MGLVENQSSKAGIEIRYSEGLPHHDVSFSHPTSWVFDCDCYSFVDFQLPFDERIE
jgi:hypothetical protein